MGEHESVPPARSTGQLPPIARFLIYGFVGWCVELLFTSVSDLAIGAGDVRLRGYSYLWMHPIWGLGILSCERLCEGNSSHLPTLVSAKL